MTPRLTVRPATHGDVPAIVAYWSDAGDAALQRMGVDLQKMPTPERLETGLRKQLDLPIPHRHAYCVLWEVDGEAIGHSNTNPTNFGRDAKMHLHLWRPQSRRQGLGTKLLRLTVPHFFDVLQLEELTSEPYARNPAPHRALERAGFEFVREFVTVPGSINFEQPVKQWRTRRSQWLVT